tara:strand:- start:1771 stop:1977 length:207 start_codon:yes stop_codon:yes gene_type:complete
MMANKNLDDFNKALKTKLEDAFGKEFINDKVIIMGLDDVDDNEDDEQPADKYQSVNNNNKDLFNGRDK